MIARRVAMLDSVAEFDAMDQLARLLPVEAIAHLVGLEAEGRERMLEWAAAAFNSIGPDQDARDLESLASSRAYVAQLSPSKVRPESWAAQLFEAASEGKISGIEAIGAISAYIVPSLDTTILAKGHLLYNLARNPDQWKLLCDKPELIQSAVLEGVRHSSVIRWFSRVASEDYAVAQQVIPKGARVMLLYGSANRDERRYAEPDRFDVTRDCRDQLAWGRGEHMCAGLYLARMEMEVMLEALVEHGAPLWAGSPVIGTNKGLFGFQKLPFRIGHG